MKSVGNYFRLVILIYFLSITLLILNACDPIYRYNVEIDGFKQIDKNCNIYEKDYNGIYIRTLCTSMARRYVSVSLMIINTLDKDLTYDLRQITPIANNDTLLIKYKFVNEKPINIFDEIYIKSGDSSIIDFSTSLMLDHSHINNCIVNFGFVKVQDSKDIIDIGSIEYLIKNN